MPAPLKPLVFRVLLALAEGRRHGWSLLREIQRTAGGARVAPPNFYRTLRALQAGGLIEETGGGQDSRDEPRRRYFRLTREGEEAVREEAHRLRALVGEPRMKRLLARGR